MSYAVGVTVSDEVYVYRNGKKVVVERYKNGKKIWDERSGSCKKTERNQRDVQR